MDMINNQVIKENKRRRRRWMKLFMLFEAVCILVLCGALVFVVKSGSKAEMAMAFQNVRDFFDGFGGERVQGIREKVYEKHPRWQEAFLTPNPYSRPGKELKKVKNIFVHYTANPGTDAAQNRSYFEQQKDTHERSVSAHFIIGYHGEIIQCLPLDEIGYAVKTRNEDSISIECCYLSEDGSFTKETYDSLVLLLQWLTEAYRLKPEDVLRHYDCGGKKCPIYYVEHEDAWEKLKQDVGG